MTENEPKESELTPAAPEAPAAPAAEPAAAHEGVAAASADEGDDDEGTDEGGDAEGAEGGEAEAAGEGPAKKKRRRRRRKKKAGAPGEGGEAAAAAGKAAPVGPFARFFEGAGAPKHAFGPGEIVAGVVTRVEHGAVVLDLFGKASAIVDELEPTEIEPLPEPPKAEGEGAAAPAEAAGEAATAPAEVTETATSAGTVAAEEHADEHAEAEAAVAAEVDATQAAPEAEGEGEDEGELEAAPARPSIEAAPKEPPKVGEIFRGRVAAVSASGHIAIVNRAIDRAKAKAAVKEAQEQRQRLQGVVFGFNRGGFDVIVEGIRAFCPASGMSLEPIEEPNAFVGQKLEFTVPFSKTGGKSIVVSRRAILERELRKQARERMKALTPGQRFHGRITEVRDYGLLVDIGQGLEGLVHMSEVSWSRGVRPSDVGKRGDEVEVEVLRVQPASRKDRHGRISLSIRACQPDPWETNAAILREGHAQKGKVVRTAEFGAFIELAPGVEGMLHISELGGKDLRHANLVLREGEEVPVLVERVDRAQRRITLSKLSGTEAEALESGTFEGSSGRAPKPGSVVTVVIEKVEHHGMQVQVQGVAGRKGRGYLANRELGELSGDRRRQLAVGSTLEVKVTGVDRDGSLRCSVKARLVDEERNAVKEYRKEAARQGFGTFGDLLRAKLRQD